MRRIDELHMAYPFAGSWMLRDLRGGEGIKVGRLHVAPLMKKMAIVAIYRRPNTLKPVPGHRIYPYLLRKLAVTWLNQVWATDITYVPTAAASCISSPSSTGAAGGCSPGGSITLYADFCIAASEEAPARFGKPEIFQHGSGAFTSVDFTGVLKREEIAISMDGKGGWRGQRVRGATLALRQIRGLPPCLPLGAGGPRRDRPLLRILQQASGRT